MGVGFKNPFKGRVRRDTNAIQPPYPGYDWEACVQAMQKNANLSQGDLATVMGSNGFTTAQDPQIIQRYQEAASQEAQRRTMRTQPSSPPAAASPGNNQEAPKRSFWSRLASKKERSQAPTEVRSEQQSAPASGVKEIQHGSMTLISFSPEELLRQVEDRRNSVSFDLSGTAKFMENFNQMWSWVGPLLFAAGTIGEIFLVLWQRQTEQSYFAAFSIVAVSMIAEGTLLAISFSAKRLRNRADKRASGWSDKERHKLNVLKRFWFLLMLCVAATQIAFVIAQTKPDGIGLAGLWIIAIVRAFSAGVADAYTAFVSEEKPTTGDKALDQTEQEGLFTSKLLTQKAKDVELLNAGAIRVQEVGMEASSRQRRMASEERMREDREKTEEEMARLQNAAKIESIKQEHEQKIMIDRMRNSAMQAIFDPDMDQGKRTQIISMLTNLMGATRELPQGHIDAIDEEGGL